jgi:hypothetical protein
VVLGTLELSGEHGIATLTGFSDGTNIEWEFGRVEFPVAVVPEPSTLLLGAGFVAILRGWKRGKALRGSSRNRATF